MTSTCVGDAISEASRRLILALGSFASSALACSSIADGSDLEGGTPCLAISAL